MSRRNIFKEAESSSDEEDPIIDEDTCNSFELERDFPVKYKILAESTVSLKKVYILHLCSDKSFGRIVAGLSNNSVQIFDINSQSLTRSRIDQLSLGDNGGVVCGVRFLDESPHNLLVGCTNGNVTLYDLRSAKAEHSFETASNVGKTNTITCFDLNANGRVICSGTDQINNEVYLQFFDVRQKEVIGAYFESHQNDVTDVKFHETNPDLLCTGSTDGLVNIFDISAPSEDDALITTINTESSVHKLNWHKNVYENDVISCITHTNDYQSYECEEGDLVSKFERSQITEAIKRKSVSDCNLVSCHNSGDGGVFLLATSNYNKGETIRSVKLQGKQLIPHGLFDGNKQIVRESVYDRKSNLLVTGGESGIVTLWSPKTPDQPVQKTDRNEFKAKKAGKLKTKTPY